MILYLISIIFILKLFSFMSSHKLWFVISYGMLDLERLLTLRIRIYIINF